MSIQCSVFSIQRVVGRSRREGDGGFLLEDRTVLVTGETGGVLDHCAEHFPDFLGQGSEMAGFFARNVAVVQGNDDPMLCFEIFSIGIVQFARKVFRKTALRPSLGNLRTHAPRGPAPLVGQRIGLFSRQSFRERKYLPGHRARSLGYDQIHKRFRKVHTRRH